MDPTRNPYAPGAGARPPELAGRDDIIEAARIAIVRARAGRHAKGQLLLGLRGVGKTVLLNRIEELAEEAGCYPILIEAPEGRGLAELLVPHLRRLLVRLDRSERRRERVRRAVQALRSFAGAFKVAVGEFEVSVEPETGLADSGELVVDLPALFVAVAQAAQEVETAAILMIDEVQYLAAEDLGALIVALHRVTQRGLPMLFFGAGLPQLAGLAGDAKSYAERLFDYPPVGPLPEADAKDAVREPAREEGADYTDDALDLIVARTEGYPYFLQEWGKHAWDTADRAPIDREDAEAATTRAIEQLDNGFFRVRLDRLTPREKQYMRAMAELGPGPHRSGDIAAQLGLSVQAVAPLRAGLIRKGMIYSPAHGDTAFTVPMFDAFMRRVMARGAGA